MLNNIIFLLSNAIQLGILALVIVLSIIHRRQIKKTLSTGILAAIITMFLGLPLQILIYKNLDIHRMLIPYIGNRLSWQVIEPVAYIIVLIVGLGGILYSAVYLVFCYSGAYTEWESISPNPFPILQYKTSTYEQKEKFMMPAGISVITGILLAAASYIVMRLCNVGESKEMETIFRQFPGLFSEPEWIQVIVFMLFVISAAITEEIMFRGVLLGFFMRITKNRIVLYIFAAVVVSALWAFLHFYNTNAPLVKLGQVFVIGLILAEMCRRWSLETAIIVHVVFNVSSIFIELFFTTLV